MKYRNPLIVLGSGKRGRVKVLSSHPLNPWASFTIRETTRRSKLLHFLPDLLPATLFNFATSAVKSAIQRCHLTMRRAKERYFFILHRFQGTRSAVSFSRSVGAPFFAEIFSRLSIYYIQVTKRTTDRQSNWKWPVVNRTD